MHTPTETRSPRLFDGAREIPLNGPHEGVKIYELQDDGTYQRVERKRMRSWLRRGLSILGPMCQALAVFSGPHPAAGARDGHISVGYKDGSSE